MLGITFYGRLSRKQYWVRILCLIIISLIIVFHYFITPKTTIEQDPENLDDMYWHTQYILAKDILSIKQSSSSDNSQELSEAILLDKSLKIIEKVYMNNLKKQVAELWKQKKGTTPTEQEVLASVDNMTKQPGFQQMQKTMMEEYKKNIEGMIKNPTSFTCPTELAFLRPISKMVANANTMSIKELQDIQASAIIRTSFTLTSIIIFLIWNVYTLMYTLSMAIRRGHDLGISGWISFFMLLIPIVGIFYAIYLLLWKGQIGSNQYG